MQPSPTLPNGVYTATLTPLKPDLRPDIDLLASHCMGLLGKGSQGIALLGTTGEANSFSVAERKAILEDAIAGGVPAEKLMVGTGCCALPDTIELSKHALEQGVGGLLVLPPFYYKQVDDDGLARYFHRFIDAVNDDRMRIYLYHFPKMSGLNFSVPFIQQLIKNYPGIIAGIKDSSGDFENMKRMIAEIPGFQVFAGTEKYLLDILRIGGAGCISATANVTVALAAQVFRSWKNGENPEPLQRYLTKVRSAFEGFPFTGALKSYLADTLQTPTWVNVRPPNVELGPHALIELKARLKAVDFSLTITKQ